MLQYREWEKLISMRTSEKRLPNAPLGILIFKAYSNFLPHSYLEGADKNAKGSQQS